MKLHKFQRAQLEAALDDGVRVGGLQIPRGNGKSTLWAAVALWALCDHPDAPQVPLVAFNGQQALRTLWWPITRMVATSPELDARVRVFKSSTDRRAFCSWNGGNLLPLPADVERLQGLNPTVALVDEAETVAPEVWTALMQGAGKRSESLVLAIGTPAPGAQESALARLRGQSGDGARVAWSEYAADAGCRIDDRRQWRKANPAIAAGMLHPDVLDLELRLVSEVEFRCYRLGQWVDGVVSSWLPSGAWEACRREFAPAEGDGVVLALCGTWSGSVALVGCTPGGAIFVAAVAERASDDDLEQVIREAARRWDVLELVVAPRFRPPLVERLQAWGDVAVWPHKLELEVESSTEWRRAIVEGRVAHDQHPLLAQHVAATVARATPDGSLRLTQPPEGGPVDVARAARMAWWWATIGPGGAVPAIW
jgi:phage terminase large subunit-like protein